MMAETLIQCKMCGGDMHITPGQNIAICEYCGSKMTVPHLSTERKTNLYNRASYSRLQNDYDKAAVLYERILEEDTEDSEIYWCIVLCKYGIEYVQDPATGRRIPNCHRTIVSPIFSDKDYLDAIKYSSPETRILYEKEAAEIDKIQKNILSLSQTAKPYDIFICYKETDSEGKRTIDSVVAQDLYDRLEKEGYSVFFARQSLKEVPGVSYEPYIYSALKSSKVMIVVASQQQYITSTWVKNEWGRFLTQIQKGEDKLLIPVYKGMDPYDLPEEMAAFQAQDANTIGFYQDIVRGIEKFFEQNNNFHIKSELRETKSKASNYVEIGFQQLEMGDKAEAVSFFQKAMAEDPNFSLSYLGLMVSDEEDKQEFYYKKYQSLFTASDEEREIDYIKQVQKSIYDFLLLFIQFGDVERVEKCITIGVDLNVEIEDLTPLCHAILTENRDMIKCICQGECDVDMLCKNGTVCAVGLACEKQSVDILEILLQAGADPDISYNNILPCITCINNNFVEGVKLLLKYGANANATYDERLWTILSLAIYNSNKEICDLLLEQGADVNMMAGGNPTFIQCIWAKDLEMAQYVIDHGADINMSWMWNNQETNIIKSCLQENNLNVAEVFIQNGCKHGKTQREILKKHLSSCRLGIKILFILGVFYWSISVPFIFNQIYDRSAPYAAIWSAILNVLLGKSTLKAFFNVILLLLSPIALLFAVSFWPVAILSWLDILPDIFSHIVPSSIWKKKYSGTYHVAKEQYKFLKKITK